MLLCKKCHKEQESKGCKGSTIHLRSRGVCEDCGKKAECEECNFQPKIPPGELSATARALIEFFAPDY